MNFSTGKVGFMMLERKIERSIFGVMIVSFSTGLVGYWLLEW